MTRQWVDAYKNGTAPKCAKSFELNMLLNSLRCEPSKPAPALELGCGNGSNYPSFKDSYIYYGIDASAEALRVALCENPELAGRLCHADFTKIPIQKEAFLVIADRAAVAHNDTESIRRCVNTVFDALMPTGIFIGVDWFGREHSEFSRGERVDEFTRTGYADGQFANIGNVHFTDQSELESVFAAFDVVLLRERVWRLPAGYPTDFLKMYYVSPHYRGKEYTASVWDIMAAKRA